jgi:glycosyltransferase involved in cell wall biosynthesis
VPEITDYSEIPLVSIVVITYNSAKFVLDTLESARFQAYKNLELIVTDDCSIDNTVEVVKKWLGNNKDLFIRTELVTTSKNSGISANCNRGAKIANGKWIKFIAGDDILLPDSIQNFIGFINTHPLANVIISKQHSFTLSEEKKEFVNIRPELGMYNRLFYDENSPATIQYDYLLKRKVLIAGPTYLIKRSLLEDLNYFDEQYKLLEDYPIFLRIVESGDRIYFLDKVTVEYRLHENAISQSGNNSKIYPGYYKDWFTFLLRYNLKHLNLLYKIDLFLEYFLYRSILILGNKGSILRFLNDNIKKFLPVHLVVYFNKNR